MESVPGDFYERQLLEVFKSCDCEGKGLLDNEGLSRLCELLHLEDGRDELMSFLLPNGSASSAPSISFNKFRDALLALLGSMTTNDPREPSPEREVSPKYIVGQKKYGRRSRPESIEHLDITSSMDESTTDDDNHIEGALSDIGESRLSSSAATVRVEDMSPERHSPINNVFKECQESGESELRNAWERLGVGRDGYLHRNELAMVCSAVGMDILSDQVVAQVFATLKTDEEGRISFDEFLELFRSRNTDSPLMIENSPPHYKLPGSDLNYLGAGGSSRLRLDLQLVKSQLESVTEERDKLRADLADANHRATILAQEIDEHHARIEKSSREKVGQLEAKHAEELKVLRLLMTAEKEQLMSANQKLEEQVVEHVEQMSKLSLEMSNLKRDYEQLERDNHSLNSKLTQVTLAKQELMEQLECMQPLQQRVIELEAVNEQSADLLEKIKSLQAQNTQLRDKNDELASQLENFVTRAPSKKESASLDFGTGNKRRGKSPESFREPKQGKVRRCCTETDLTLAASRPHKLCVRLLSDSEDVSFEDEEAFHTGSSQSLAHCFLQKETEWDESHSEIMEKMRERIAELEAAVDKYQMKEWLSKSHSGDGDSFSTCLSTESTQVAASLEDIHDLSLVSQIDPVAARPVPLLQATATQTESPLVHLEKHCHELENELERVRDKIIAILSERRACTEENCALKQTLQTLMKNNNNNNNNSNNKNAASPSLDNDELVQASLKFLPDSHSEVEETDSVAAENRLASRSSALERTPPDGETMECLGCGLKKGRDSTNKSDLELIRSLKYENERLTARCRELENSLELMRVEYEKTEDYWANKLDEERRLFEMDQQQSDEKFAELEAKIHEYAELIASDQCRKPTLPPIEEKDFLERQFTELDEEFDMYKNEAEAKLAEKDETIMNLMASLEEFNARSTKLANKEVQTSSSEINKKDALKVRHRHSASSPKLSGSKSDDFQIFHTISSRLKRQENRCRDLQTTLKNQQKQAEQILQRAWARHKADLNTLQQALSATQDNLQQQKRYTKQQLEKLALTDGIVKDLTVENAQLSAAVSFLEQKFQSSSQSMSNSL